jgi:hypothetical protein
MGSPFKYLNTMAKGYKSPVNKNPEDLRPIFHKGKQATKEQHLFFWDTISHEICFFTLPFLQECGYIEQEVQPLNLEELELFQ